MQKAASSNKNFTFGRMRKTAHFVLKFKILHVFYWIYAALTHYHNLKQNRVPSYQYTALDVANDIACQMLCVYFIIYYLAPKLYYRQKYAAFIGAAILTVLCTSAIGTYVAWTFIGVHDEYNFNTLLHFISHFFDFSVVAIIFTIIVLIEYYYRKDKKNKQLETERLEAELNFLKAQMNPHFLFNALNSIYVLIDEDKCKSKDTLVKFSALLRYQLYDCAKQNTSLAEEYQFLSDYIALEKIRSGESLKIEFEASDVQSPNIIAPLLLIPFVENAFKHISHFSDRANFIRIKACESEKKLIFTVANSFDGTKTQTSGGIGLVNVRRRLELLYPEKHTLKISTLDNMYQIQLEIQL